MGEERRREEAEQEQDPSPTRCSLRQAVALISSLITLSYSTKVFAAKWQLIRNKLEELNSGMAAAEDCASVEDPSLSGLVPSVFATLGQCCDLARRCVDLSYSGKLLMQSDLDVISAKLDRHAKNLAALYTAGVLTHRNALVVSRPGLGACRDDMRFYVRDLLTRMKIGDADMRRRALVDLHEVMLEDDKYVNVTVEVSDIVALLVVFLDSPESEIQELSARVATVIAGFESHKGVLIGAGVIAPLSRVLEGGSEKGAETAARCLQKLTQNSDNAWSVSAHGGVTALLKICARGDSSKAQLIGPACGVLRNLVAVEEIKRFMVEESAVSTFIKLARSNDETVQINSIELLRAMVSGDEPVRQLVVREGGIRVLVRVLDPKSSSSSKTREVAFAAIESFCFANATSVRMLLSHGYLDHLLYFLRHGETSAQELALKAVYRLCGTSEEAKKAMGDVGFMPELVKLLDAKSFEVRETAGEALARMVSLPKNRKRFVQDDRNISLLLQLLDPEKSLPGEKRPLLSILLSLAACSGVRRKIANSEYLRNIKQLAEAEISDAKRLVRKLSTSRFHSIFRGIWHSGT